MNLSCRACQNKKLKRAIDLGLQPIAHRLLDSPDSKAKVYPFSVYFCQACGLLQIKEPIAPKELYLDYNYCFSSWKDEPHAIDEINIIFKYCKPESVFEVASNDGKFLNLLKERSIPLLVGLEPNPFASQKAKEKGFKVYSELFNDAACKRVLRDYGKFDLVIAREVLEHILDIPGFFKCVDALLKDNGFLFIDTPDVETGLSMGDCSILWEEHPNYFTESVISNILKKFGYEPLSIRKYNFSGGVMGILAKRMPSSQKVIATDGLKEKVTLFKQRVNEYGKFLRDVLMLCKDKGYKIILYGVGCRGCTAVNVLNLGKLIDFAVDDQTERQAKYMPASRLPIMSPEKIKDLRQKFICLLAVNQENESLIKNRLNKAANKEIEFISILSPSNIWDELERLKSDNG